jgi:hypothetical protein
MEAAMRSAWMKAGMKMGLGFFVVAAVLGIRVVSVAPVDGASETAGDGTVFEKPAAAAMPTTREEGVANAEESSMGGSGAAAPESLAGSGSADRRAGDQMVSCRIRGTTQFMTADDCAMRGGHSTLFESDR